MKMAVSFEALIISVIVNTIVIAPALWLSGRALAGKDKARFLDAVWIVVLGTVVGAVVGAFFTGFWAAIIQLIIWLALVKHFFDCGWLKALVISIFAVIIFVAIVVILGLIGIAIVTIWL